MKWPDQDTVLRSLEIWMAEATAKKSEVLRIGYFGSLARGDWGVGSDLDLIIIVAKSDEPFVRRGIAWDTSALPVPADVLIYTLSEWKTMDPNTRFSRMLLEEVNWVYERDQ
jgi:predicted nucleotidyltransferase